MTTRWADGFEDDAAANLNAEYTVYNSPTIVTGRRTGTSALRCNGNTQGVLRAIGGTEATMFQSVAMKVDVFPTPAASRFFIKFTEGATVHISLFVTAAGAIAVYKGNFTTLLGTSANFFTLGVWTWLQVKAVIHDTTGSVEIRDASGSVVLAISGADTRNAGTGYCDTVGCNSSTSLNADISFDDFHVWDATGSICNTWTNDTRIDHKLPTGAGNSASFTPSAGANYTCVDEANYNTTDYVESSTAGHKDSYAFGDISHAPPNIFAVLVTAVAQKDDAGARSLKGLVRSGGTDYSGSAVTLNQGSYSRVVDIRETDPATSAAWTQTNVNAAEFGFENV